MRDRDERPVHVVVPPVEWDIISARQFEETLDSFTASSAIQVDCGAVAFMDSAGLNSLIRVHHRCVEAGGHLEIVNPPELVLRVLRITATDELFTIKGKT